MTPQPARTHANGRGQATNGVPGLDIRRVVPRSTIAQDRCGRAQFLSDDSPQSGMGVLMSSRPMLSIRFNSMSHRNGQHTVRYTESVRPPLQEFWKD